MILLNKRKKLKKTASTNLVLPLPNPDLKEKGVMPLKILSKGEDLGEIFSNFTHNFNLRAVNANLLSFLHWLSVFGATQVF